ncbi:hypothetical protein Pla111_00850 [Botrimarina hoheduenensis]|uniref:Uncharacterized protein n=2 Tax=Botrimarina hoheduenensis TaxID=2528000 RepID=A0A5C5WEZ3_9BACT|nr:hypothetical protein Pla111_00850 [Botrimarina hoheduenensis]
MVLASVADSRAVCRYWRLDVSAINQHATVAGIESLGGSVHYREPGLLPASWSNRVASWLGDDTIIPVVTALLDELLIARQFLA